MHTSFKSIIPRLVGGSALILFAVAANYLYASWTPPPSSPPQQNAPEVLNIGNSYQQKDAGLTLGLLVLDGPLQLWDTTQGVDKVLVSDATGNASWQDPSTLSFGGGGISQVSQGAGIILTPNPATDTSTVAADTNYLQRRVSSACPGGQAIRSIAADGTVQCEPIASGGGSCVYEGRTYSPGENCRMGRSGLSCATSYRVNYLTCQSDGTWSSGTSLCGYFTGISTSECGY